MLLTSSKYGLICAIELKLDFLVSGATVDGNATVNVGRATVSSTVNI
jgi:hypothetical protein